MTSLDPRQTISLMIRSREEILYRDEVLAVSSTNARGNFDILPKHAHFISLVQKELLIHEKTGNTRQFPIKLGIMHVEDNTVRVYLENWKE